MTDDHTPVADTFQRSLRDLRISVTDRCNFRCTYCMPKEINREWESLGRDLLLSLEEIERLVRIFAELGVRKVRITGGEPLLRKNLEHLIVGLSAIDGIDDLALTTKGPLLVRRAAALETAGLNRVSVSLDSLNDTVFRAMNDVDSPVARVLDGISVAAEAGPGPVKINAVIQRGVNDHTIVDMVREFRGTGHILRFIEYMDVGGTNGRRLDDVVPAGEIIETVNEVYPLEVLASHYPGEVVRRFGYVDDGGEIGVIASVTIPFCGSRTRVRVPADGSLYTCLFATTGHDLRSALRSSASDEEIAVRIRHLWEGREDQYSELRSSRTSDLPRVEMSCIGG